MPADAKIAMRFAVVISEDNTTPLKTQVLPGNPPFTPMDNVCRKGIFLGGHLYVV